MLLLCLCLFVLHIGQICGRLRLRQNAWRDKVHSSWLLSSFRVLSLACFNRAIRQFWVSLRVFCRLRWRGESDLILIVETYDHFGDQSGGMQLCSQFKRIGDPLGYFIMSLFVFLRLFDAHKLGRASVVISWRYAIVFVLYYAPVYAIKSSCCCFLWFCWLFATERLSWDMLLVICVLDW